jgi:hypothetical protein
MRQIILITILCLIGNITYSQLPVRRDHGDVKVFANKKYDGEQDNKRMQQIQSVRIAFFTSEMELTPEEAELFWPIYNKMWKEKESSHNAAQKALRDIQRHINNEQKLATEADLKALLAIYVDNTAAIGAVDKRCQAEFLTIISAEKLAKLYKAEEDFRMRMIHQLRREPEKPGERKRDN